jgi:hypothetical protein
MSSTTDAVAGSIRAALAAAAGGTVPFRHWLLADVFPEGTCAALGELPLAAPATPAGGRRELTNSVRTFFSEENRRALPTCDVVAQAFQAPDIVGEIARVCAASLDGSFLRIEYCQDTDGFWLEPHTDIGAKLFTMLVYLPEPGETAELGTDLYDHAGRHIATTPYLRNHGLMFVPGPDTWHGFEPRPIRGWRRSLIVNYVVAAWRSRHELSFPDRPVG